MINVFLIEILAFFLILDLSRNKSNEPFQFEQKNTNLYKGICAFIILLHHITQCVNASVFIYFGYLCVGGFFWVSGYGMTCSWLKRRDKYAKTVCLKKIPQILAMCIITIIYMSLYYTLWGEYININDLIGIFHGNRLLNWYFPAIIIVYLLYASAIKIAKGDSKKLVCSTMILITLFEIVLGFLYLKEYIGIHWLVSLYAFPVGVWFALLKNKNEIIKFLINYRVLIVMMFIFLFWLINYSEIESRMRVFIYLSGEIFLTLIFSFIIYIYSLLFSSRRFFRWLGKNSAEMILTQSLVLHLWKNSILSIPNNVLYVILCLITQIILMRVTIPLYDRVRGIVNCHLLPMSKYK